MKLSARDAAVFFDRPDPARAGILIYGPDAMRCALRREQVIAKLIGLDGANEMRLTRMTPQELRGDPAALSDAVRAQGFFPGPRVVFIEDATETVAKAAASVLEDWQQGDAQLVVTAGNLSKGNALRKLFEGHRNAVAAAVYADPPSRADVEASVARAGLRDLPATAMADLVALAQTLDPGDFAQTLEKLSLYKLDDPEPVCAEDIAAVAPLSVEAELDEMLNAVAEGRTDRIGPTLQRLHAQGIAPVTMAIGATRHFRTLHAIAAHPGGPSQGIGALRPPIFGPRRDRMQRQAGQWGRPRLEDALATLVDADLALRSGGATAPQHAMMERALMRLTFLARR
ncbi:DNA polymerase III subunit delta [Meridianimarinicoccus aquatilis]|uniref:DNA-directed DNA polymerase n=1 Tax=Meridianimarinicoccus aquatilis TaxID=2552766 RepID=A0A4R6AJT8_9RHOB|nr:DNA polymerase III subunit delta [Fluviibacterium aquatile]TDL84501.1 DNA polymerase III subunit delta [Fluviibacterium aquatile]